MILADAPLGNLHEAALEENGMPDGLVRLQRNDPGLQTLYIGTEADCGYDRPYSDDWGRTGKCIAAHEHLQELEFGRMDQGYSPVALHQFNALCRELPGSKISRLTFSHLNPFRGKEFQALLPFLETTATLTELRLGGEDYYPPPGVTYDRYGVLMLSRALSAFSSLLEVALPFVGICEGAAEELFEALGQHPGLKILDLSGNDIGRDESMGCLTRLLERPQSQLECLKLHNISSDRGDRGIGDEGAEILARGVRGSSLRRLDISGNCFIGETGWRAVFSALESQSCMLEQLNLSGCNFNHEGMVSLAKYLAVNESIKRLHLSYLDESSLIPQTWAVFFECLRESHLEALDLRGNEFSDRHVIPLGTSLAGNSHLKELELARNGDISIGGLRSITSALRSPHTALEHLSIRWETINDDEAILDFVNAISINRTLQHLCIDTDGGFTNHNITDVGWAAMANALCNKTNITATYDSNHTFSGLHYIGHWDDSQMPAELILLCGLNSDDDNRRVARRKIIQTHFGQDNSAMRPLAEIELEVAPHLIAWLGRDDGRPESEKEGKELLFRLFRSMPDIFSLRQNRKRKFRQATLLDMGYQRG
ncbi:hypothetical protein ACHAXT_009659 [Thalassiosira profunda]